MAITKAAEVVRKYVTAEQKQRQMTERGWCPTFVPAQVLEELSIDYDHEGSGSKYRPGAQVFAPAWVFATWYLRAEPKTNWAIVKGLLLEIRNDSEDKEMICAELSLNGGVARSIRQAARNCLYVLRGEPVEKESND